MQSYIEVDKEDLYTLKINLGSKITADGDRSHEIKRYILLGRKVMNNLDSILKSRDITLPTKVHLVKAMLFPVVMYGCESWTMKKAEHQTTDAFELWCWRRLLRVPWTARRSNQSILKEITLGISLEGMMLKPRLCCPQGRRNSTFSSNIELLHLQPDGLPLRFWSCQPPHFCESSSSISLKNPDKYT